MHEQEAIQLIRSATAFMGNIDGNRPRVRPVKPYVSRCFEGARTGSYRKNRLQERLVIHERR